MESANKQAASECLKKAERKFAEGDLKSSLRLAEKSLRMYQSEEAKELVNRIQSKIASSSSSADTSANGEGVRQRRRQEETEGKDSTGEPSAPSYTPQQQQSVDRVIKCSCFYEVLLVEKEDGVEVIKKAYRKLALQLHPDKNKAPRSSEAFKKVSKAYDTLSDPEKRKMYDQFGEQGLQGAQHGGFSRHYYTTTDEFDADKLFRDFFGFSNFGSGFGTTTFYFDDDGGDNFVFSTGPRTRRVHTGPFRTRIDNRQGNVMFSYLLFLIPMFLVFVLPILVEIFSPPEFRLEKFSDYNVQREIKQNDISLVYFVKSTFDTSASSVRRMEKNVLLTYADRYFKRCQEQRMRKAYAQRSARNAAEIHRASKISTEDCDFYNKLLQVQL